MLLKNLPVLLASVQPFGFLTQVQMSRGDIRCKRVTGGGTIFHFHENRHNALAEGSSGREEGDAEGVRSGAGGGGKGCSELGTEIHYERREAGK